MWDKAKILAWVVVFVVLVALPFYYNIVKSSSMQEVSLDTPVINKMTKKQCVKDADVMRKNHMKLLDEWRNDVVRDGEREYGIIDGVKYEKSLQKTCMKCHSNKKDFCDRCHTYVDVKPYCWNCHIAPEGLVPEEK